MPLWRADEAALLRLSKYDRICTYLFRRISRPYLSGPLPNEMPFDLDDVRKAMVAAAAAGVIDREVANVPDVKYTYDARRDLPEEVEQQGPWTWLQNGKGKYLFTRTRRRNIIRLPGDVAPPELELEVDQTPPFIRSLLGNDEQATFTRVRNVGLISKVLGFMAWPIQGHHRTTVSFGQVEVDEVQAGLDRGIGTIVPISGKGGQDRLSWSQALNLNTYAAEKAPISGLRVRSIGLWRDDVGSVWIVEFSPHTNIDQIEIVSVRRFAFK